MLGFVRKKRVVMKTIRTITDSLSEGLETGVDDLEVSII